MEYLQMGIMLTLVTVLSIAAIKNSKRLKDKKYDKARERLHQLAQEG